ncbi:hypothetical protein [Rhodopila sp.]|uniref:hypothetical protein n=1 Tax=Rhodopila sp. TaxID=2480087 RepID=UPI003D0E597B
MLVSLKCITEAESHNDTDITIPVVAALRHDRFKGTPSARAVFGKRKHGLDADCPTPHKNPPDANRILPKQQAQSSA